MVQATAPGRPASDRDGAATTPASEGDALGLFTTLARTGLFVEALQRESLSRFGLAFTEYSVLRLLQRAPRRRLAPTTLAEQVVCTTGAMTKLVDRLERAGLVERAPDPTDRRGILVRLTPAGSRTATAAARVYTAARRRILSRLDEREARRVHDSLQRLLEVLEADRRSR
jgi:DNA-binding MarR family transcriptional regulator